MSTRNPDYHGYRLPPEIISYVVWLYHRFCLSLRDVEEFLAERGVSVSDEAVRQWCLKFGPSFAKKLQHRQGRLGDTWHLDELVVTIAGTRHSLWRAGDHDGEVLDILGQKQQDTCAVKRFFRKLLKGLHYVPRRLVTDTLGSYGAARRELLPSVSHCQGKRANNRAEVSYQPTRAPQASFQLSWASPTLSFDSWLDQQSLPPRPPSLARSPLSYTPHTGACDVTRGDRVPASRLTRMRRNNRLQSLFCALNNLTKHRVYP